jgi:hypothetical protein
MQDLPNRAEGHKNFACIHHSRRHLGQLRCEFVGPMQNLLRDSESCEAGPNVHRPGQSKFLNAFNDRGADYRIRGAATQRRKNGAYFPEEITKGFKHGALSRSHCFASRSASTYASPLAVRAYARWPSLSPALIISPRPVSLATESLALAKGCLVSLPS